MFVTDNEALTETAELIYDGSDDPFGGCSTIEIEWVSGDPIQVCVEGIHEQSASASGQFSPPFSRTKQYCAHGDRITKVYAKASDSNGSVVSCEPISHGSPQK